MTRLGMDVDVVDQVSRDLKRSAGDLASIASQVARLVENATHSWSGPDARAFADQWRQVHQPAFHRVQEAIEGLSRSAANNVREQRDASDDKGGSSVGPSAPPAHPGTPPVSPGHPQPTQPPSGGSDAHSAVATHFRDSIVGKHVDFDHAYGAQCFDVFQKYNREVVGGPFIGGDSAHQIYDNYASNGAAAHYLRVPASAGPPHPGDVAVWAANAPHSGGAGHVAVVTTVNGNTFEVVEQNGNNPDGVAYTSNRSSSDQYLLGYLRPKT